MLSDLQTRMSRKVKEQSFSLSIINFKERCSNTSWSKKMTTSCSSPSNANILTYECAMLVYEHFQTANLKKKSKTTKIFVKTGLKGLATATATIWLYLTLLKLNLHHQQQQALKIFSGNWGIQRWPWYRTSIQMSIVSSSVTLVNKLISNDTLNPETESVSNSWITLTK